jgi:hypothetical protein
MRCMHIAQKPNLHPALEQISEDAYGAGISNEKELCEL